MYVRMYVHMYVRRPCLCLLSLVQPVKPEVGSVFKEKIAQGDGWMDRWKDGKREV